MKEANLEKLIEKVDFVKFGPLYLGACGINKWGAQELLFIAGCDEEKIYETERFLYREIAVIFENNGVKIGTPVLGGEE